MIVLYFPVPETGFEPAHPFGRRHLKTVRLPISPFGRDANITGFNLSIKMNHGQKTLNLNQIVLTAIIITHPEPNLTLRFFYVENLFRNLTL